MAYSLVKGDLGRPMDITLGVPAAVAALPTATSVKLLWTKPDKTQTLVDLTVIDAGTAKLERTWIAGDTDMVGLHRGIVQVTNAAGKVISDPDDGTHLLWWIYSQ